MNELELRLQELGGEIAYPATPRFEPRVRPPAGAPSARCARSRSASRSCWPSLAGVLALSPGARSAFLEIFHIRGATVERVETLPDVRAQRLDYGERVSRAEAERRVGFELLDLGSEPDAIFVRPDGLASVVYGDPARPAARALAGARRDLGRLHQEDRPDSGTIIDEVTVDGEPGLFVAGPEHFVMFLDENGLISDERTYLAGTVLLWNRGDRLLRLEGDLTEEEALELAESVE